MAASCAQEEITILGYCSDIQPKRSLYSNEIYDIGVIAQDKDKNTFWCHCNRVHLDGLEENYFRIKGEETNDN